MDVIQVEHIRKRFGDKDALVDVSFSIPKGEIFGFLGPSGSGKTTLIKILTAQLNPTSGRASVFNQPSEMMQHSSQKMRFGMLTDNIALHERLLVEQHTGEGKTLSAVMPALLNALTGKGVHVLTFNDYLAHRDAEWMGPIYRFLGLTVSAIQTDMSLSEKREAYAKDITYVTAKEAGFDYLRDAIALHEADTVHRPFHYVIVDEADSLLLDEARVPLVIASEPSSYTDDDNRFAEVVRQLKQEEDYNFDEYKRNVYLNEAGSAKAE